MNPLLIIGIASGLFILGGIRVIFEYKRALKFRFGKYIKTLQPGFRWIIPIVETIQVVDIRVITFNIDSQEVMTEDNVPCSIDGVVFFKIDDPVKAVLEVEEYTFAITQLAQAALRDVCGKVELDTILSKREEMGKNIKAIVEQETEEWGIVVIDVKINGMQEKGLIKLAEIIKICNIVEFSCSLGKCERVRNLLIIKKLFVSFWNLLYKKLTML